MFFKLVLCQIDRTVLIAWPGFYLVDPSVLLHIMHTMMGIDKLTIIITTMYSIKI